ncbi:heavy metal translocating P-type ATPase [Roseiarcaceae bacterium H3SJ34-1]|uniref:heavy metal translocating P-type ATPase n=1 Tax=Terripilifer ovatus TaxID=3032367 RepID=UPI003AB9709D|nr:heavy metal translocating P-type ATPase [Roseiarcaceae bacterium H3SJ34-1]
MSCCVPLSQEDVRPSALEQRNELLLASRALGNGLYQTDLSVPGVHCAHCIRTVETGLMRLPEVEAARVNLSTRRASVKWRGEQAPALIETLADLGFPAHVFEETEQGKDPELARLIRALAVAGFAAMNIMLQSVSIWSGAEPETRQAFHWISAALALPCLVYSGRIFFISAWSALKTGRTNMDVPISIGVSLAVALSLYDTIEHGTHAYFDAATSLIFFLLIGRTLDRVMREKARAAVQGLIRLTPRGATVLRDGGGRDYVPVNDIAPGMRIALAAGDRAPVDGRVEEGRSEFDCALATGESAPQPVAAGDLVQAGTLNLTGALVMVATARAQDSFLAEMVRLMEAAEGGRARYRRLADRIASLYSPVVHAAAFLTFVGWMVATGDWHRAISIAIAVLIITCPCALGLAVPIVQVMAARRLFENGILVKDGSGIERLAEIDTAVFDKTGTLTERDVQLGDIGSLDRGALAMAAALGLHSKHPQSRALSQFAGVDLPALTDVREYAGLGIEGRHEGRLYRLGRAAWAAPAEPDTTDTVLAVDGLRLATYRFEERLRPGACAALDALRADGASVRILSGDNATAVAAVADALAVAEPASGLLPGEKVERLAELAAQGHRTLMVGDGLNDAPALTAAHVSMAPASAADIGRSAADFVFLRDDLGAVPLAYGVAREAGRLVRQNFVLAITYNAIALPVAVLGHVTPLIAALAMSLSSVLVVANALRLKVRRPLARPAAAPATIGPARWKTAGGTVE